MRSTLRSKWSIKALRPEYFFLAILQFAVVFMVPTTIPYDGFGYLTSGKSLFSSNFPYWYYAVREPGYPFLIWISTNFGDPILALSFMQATILLFSAILVFNIAHNYFKVSRVGSLAVSSLGLLLVRGNATTVLQTSLIILIFTLGAYVLISNRLNETNLKAKRILLWLLFGLVSASVNSAIFGAVLVAFILVSFFDKRIKLINRQLISFIFGAALIFIPWNAYFSTVNLADQAIPSVRSGFSFNFFSEESFMSQNTQRVQSTGALLFLGPEVYASLDPKIATVGGEAILLGNPINYHEWSPCKRQWDGPQYVLDFVEPLLRDRCKPRASLVIQSYTSKALLPLIPLSGIALIMNLGISIHNRDYNRLKLALRPILTILVYAYKGAGVSRYSSPILVFGPLLVFLVFQRSFKSNSEPKANKKHKAL